MDDIYYDLNKLSTFDEFDEASVKRYVGAEMIYFAMLEDFTVKWKGYLSSYNPTVVIYGEQVRKEFIDEMNYVRNLMVNLGVKESETGIEALEDAIENNSEKGLSDGLLTFSAKSSIIVERINQSKVQANVSAYENTQIVGAQPTAPKEKKPVIFAVDDSPVMLDLIRQILGDAYTTITVTSGEDAMAALQKHVPDLFLIDIEMPDMSGHQLVETLRKIDSLKQTPILFVTSSASREHVYAAKKLGIRDYLLKPFQKDVLIKKISMYLR